MSARSSRATNAPRRGTASTRLSWASSMSASRTGNRLMPSVALTSSWSMRVPGTSLPLRICSRRYAAAACFRLGCVTAPAPATRSSTFVSPINDSPMSSADGQAQLAADHDALDLAGSLADLEHLRVTVEAAHRRLVHDAAAAEDLGRMPRRVDGRLGRVQLGHRGRLPERTAGVLQPRGLVGEQPRVLDHDREVGATEGDPLVGADRRTERHALACVLDAVLEARLRQADRERGDRDAPVVE